MDFRPISAQCILSRVVASATVQRPEFQAWVTGLVSSDVHRAIKGRSVGDAVARLQEEWCEDEALLISLDLMKGFAISVGLMAHLGLPDLWVKHFRHVSKTAPSLWALCG